MPRLGAPQLDAIVIERYSSPEITEIFSDISRFSTWLEIELLSVEAWARLGFIPQGEAEFCRGHAPVVDGDFVAEVTERERVTDHDVAAFVDVTQTKIGFPQGSWIHYGLTSSDVVDTALSCALTRACDQVISALDGLVGALKSRALEHASTPMMGRTHGMAAEPTTFGAKLALWCLQVDRDRTRMKRAREVISVGKLSGAVGTYSNIDPKVEQEVCSALGLTPVPATQVIARDRHGEYLYALASIGSSIESFATEIRHLQRSEVGEVFEPFKTGQKGSSAMPHKRNPILSERLCGIARILRGFLGAGLENVALWHERDISHSSVERVVLPDATQLAYYATRKMTNLIDGLEVNPDQMMFNIQRTRGVSFSQSVLLELIRGGLDRDSAYRIVQRDTRVALDEGKDLKEVLTQDREVTVPSARLEEIFSIDRLLKNAGLTIDALGSIS